MGTTKRKRRRRILRALVVDDEPLAREGLRRLLDREQDIVVVGECADGLSAIDAVGKLRPDLMFLDIQMPEVDGFEVLRAVGMHAVPAVIFVTAHDEHALKAFDVHAVDYLLKPIDPDRFHQCLERLRRGVGKGGRELSPALNRRRALLQEISPGEEFRERVLVRTRRRVVVLQLDFVDWIEAKGDYVQYHAGENKYLVREKISDVEKRLNPARFVRIHRSCIVNIDRIREMEPQAHGDHRVILKDGTRLILSRGYRTSAFRRIAGPSAV